MPIPGFGPSSKGHVDGTSATSYDFDSNCITPGTEFMERLSLQLQFFVEKKINEDPLWRGIEVIISGADVPGEGEHVYVMHTARYAPAGRQTLPIQIACVQMSVFLVQ